MWLKEKQLFYGITFFILFKMIELVVYGLNVNPTNCYSKPNQVTEINKYCCRVDKCMKTNCPSLSNHDFSFSSVADPLLGLIQSHIYINYLA